MAAHYRQPECAESPLTPIRRRSIDLTAEATLREPHQKGEREAEPTAERRQRELRERIREGRPIVLDGALGTELERRHIPSALPLWSTHALLEAPWAVRAIHGDHARAGAEILTAGTFRTQQRSLAHAGIPLRARELTQTAVNLARDAASSVSGRVWVAGSAAPLEDCYRPDLAPDETTAQREHEQHAKNLADAGVDLILIETQNTIREARAAARAAAATGLPFLVSFVSWESATLLSGEPLARACDEVLAHGPAALLVNCLPAAAVERCLQVLRATGVPFGAYANLGPPLDESGPTGSRRREDLTPDEFATYALTWLAAGAQIVGGCCGTQPEHVRAISERVHNT